MSLCSCGGCREIFTSLASFDAHQDVDYRRGLAVICRPPAEAGLIRGNDGRWHLPLSAAGAQRLTNLRASHATGVSQ